MNKRCGFFKKGIVQAVLAGILFLFAHSASGDFLRVSEVASPPPPSLSTATGTAGMGTSSAQATDEFPADQEIRPGIASESRISPILLARFPLRTPPIATETTAENGSVSGSISEKPVQTCALVGYRQQILFLDSTAGTIFSATGSATPPVPFINDQAGKGLRMHDFAIPGTDRVAIADNSRQAVFLFRKWRFEKRLGEFAGRSLFRYIQDLWADPDEGRLGVYDSGRVRTLVFTAKGTLLDEREGRFEPVFWNHELVRITRKDNGCDIITASLRGKKERTVFSYSCPPGLILLDVWCAGVAAQRLVTVLYEGVDEDHPSVCRVLLLAGGKTTESQIGINSDMQLGLRRPFAVMSVGNNDYLTEVQPEQDLAAVFGYLLPEPSKWDKKLSDGVR